MKSPPAINAFNRTIDKNQAAELLKVLVKYRPETKEAKVERIENVAKATAAGETAATSAPGPVLKFGLKHVTTLIEQKKAKLVVIAHDVDPIELVVWLPALCRKMGIPFCILKGKSRLGSLVHMKNCSAVCLTAVNKEDEAKLKSLQESVKEKYLVPERKWGGGIMGLKTVAKLEKRRKQMEIENAKKEAALNR